LIEPANGQAGAYPLRQAHSWYFKAWDLGRSKAFAGPDKPLEKRHNDQRSTTPTGLLKRM
jgi:hypothetical protein